MASSSQDPQLEYSMWLQRRSRRVGWRTDWTPVGFIMFLLTLLILLSVLLPANDTVEQVRQAGQDASNGAAERALVGVLAEP